MTSESPDTPETRIREARKQVTIAIELLAEDARGVSDLEAIRDDLDEVFDDLGGTGDLDQLFGDLDGVTDAEQDLSPDESR